MCVYSVRIDGCDYTLVYGERRERERERKEKGVQTCISIACDVMISSRLFLTAPAALNPFILYFICVRRIVCACVCRCAGGQQPESSAYNVPVDK